MGCEGWNLIINIFIVILVLVYVIIIFYIYLFVLKDRFGVYFKFCRLWYKE